MRIFFRGTRIRAVAALWPALCIFHLPSGHAADTGRPNLEGVWILPQTAPEDPHWTIEDFLCNGAFCTLATIDYMKTVLADPKSDSRPLKDLHGQISSYGKRYVNELLTLTEQEAARGYKQLDDPVNRCIPTGFNFADGPLPIEIKQFSDRVVIRYEFWNSVRTVRLSKDPPPRQASSRLGNSIGWYEGATLVVETSGIAPHLTYWADGARSSDRASVYEKYTRSEDGTRLIVQKTFVDPVMLRRPLTTRESRLFSDSTKLMDYQCDTKYEKGFEPHSSH